MSSEFERQQYMVGGDSNEKLSRAKQDFFN